MQLDVLLRIPCDGVAGLALSFSFRNGRSKNFVLSPGLREFETLHVMRNSMNNDGTA